MKLFAFFAAALAQDFNETDSRMYGAQGSAIDGCQGPICEAEVQAILDATDALHIEQEEATVRHEAERAAMQAEQQTLQAAFEQEMERVRLEFEQQMQYWQGNHTEMNQEHQQDWADFGIKWTEINGLWGAVDWSQ